MRLCSAGGAGFPACATLLLIGLVGPALSAGPPTVRDLYDWTNLPVVGGPRVLEVTNTREATPGLIKDATPGQAVLLDEQGAGCLLRLSISKQAGQLKIYLDGAPAPQVDIPVKSLHPQYTFWEFWEPKKFASFDTDHPQVFPFLAPLCSSAPAWQNWCLLPITYAQSVKVVFEHDQADVWTPFSLLYEKLPVGAKYATYAPAAMEAQKDQVWAAAKAWRVVSQRPCTYPDEQRQAGTLALAPQATADLWKGAGAGTIVSLRVKASPWNKAIDRRLVLRAYWDGETRPAIETPLGELCTSEAGTPNGQALAAGRGKDGWYYFYLPMPYANGARLTLQNYTRYPGAGARLGDHHPPGRAGGGRRAFLRPLETRSTRGGRRGVRDALGDGRREARRVQPVH